VPCETQRDSGKFGLMVTAADVKTEARRLGFVACGIAALGPSNRGAELDRWLAAGHAGTMRYLHRQAARRKAPATIVPGAACAVVVLENYFAPQPQVPGQPTIAKFARGLDYHQVTGQRLEQLAAFLRSQGAQSARTFLDAGPVPERELAQRAGLGWIGKNTMLIRPGGGSYCLIGSIFTDLALTPDPPFEADHCGTCGRCLEACPTEAFVEPRVLDATRCISYLTIEYRGEFQPGLPPRLKGWAFGCDICNDVCPWNLQFASLTCVEELRPCVGELDSAGPEYFDRMDEVAFETRFGATALERAGLKGMRRNWKVAYHRTDASPAPPDDAPAQIHA